MRAATHADSRGPERTRQRLLDEACRLFAMHSFAGTSLQMIADTLGVTKAAVYHHFRTRDDILTAVIQPAISEMYAIIEAAEAQRTPSARADAMLSGLVDLTVKHRGLIAMIGTDPGVTSALQSHPDVVELFRRPGELMALDGSAEAEINATLALAGIATTASSPVMQHHDADVLRRHLLAAGRRILGLRARKT
ncbi:TetR family transcriptional regulator [Catellatospora methionotrophica]|uniref:TetR family transcriptional regulator n=1 Tax=Catellatospora methionotrophica TaxID=121620 RepID=A0A8J3L503_9ACTN|nr:helix-turn-helix domain-containing protein [Catellatospora methionotrophica]GIG12232.1 TetR family transcriptional regulator [Catellatospora methionotrophica]